MMSQVEGPTWPLLGEAGEEEEDGGKTLIKSSQGGRESEPSNIWLSMKILPVHEDFASTIQKKKFLKFDLKPGSVTAGTIWSLLSSAQKP